ncbi:MAG: ABC transporter substrate-binding protein [Clostridiales bacterium]|nr:ABC transporter substrate-binding protein [Clostridiales bacterium]
MNRKLLWNNICLLSRFEEEYINTLGIQELDVDYFGMGRETGLVDYFKNEANPWDIVVSTNTDVFQDKSLLHIRKETLLSLVDEDFLPKLNHPNLYSEPKFLPFIVIPLVIVINTGKTHLRPKSLEELCSKEYCGQVTFGGIHNSAGRSLIKIIWSLYGKSSAKALLDNSVVGSMPAASFKKVMDGEVPIAVVPTIFAARSGLNDVITVNPIEGAVAIPSFIAINKECPKEEYAIFFEKIAKNKEFHKILWERGKIISPYIEESHIQLCYPEKSFLDSLDDCEFYEFLKKRDSTTF